LYQTMENMLCILIVVHGITCMQYNWIKTLFHSSIEKSLMERVNQYFREWDFHSYSFYFLSYQRRIIIIILSFISFKSKFHICQEKELKSGTEIYVKLVSHPTGPIVIIVLKLDSLKN
jgi:hypothetical protein